MDRKNVVILTAGVTAPMVASGKHPTIEAAIVCAKTNRYDLIVMNLVLFPENGSILAGLVKRELQEVSPEKANAIKIVSHFSRKYSYTGSTSMVIGCAESYEKAVMDLIERDRSVAVIFLGTPSDNPHRHQELLTRISEENRDMVKVIVW